MVQPSSASKRGRAPVKITINDVAADAGVSRQTVTRAMNAMAGISPATRERVLDTARRLGYRPSRFGRALVKGDQHRTIGLVLDDLTNPFYPELASALIGFAATAGWNVVLADTRHAPDRTELLTDLVAQVDAVVGFLWLDPVTQAGLLDGLPVVKIDPEERSPVHGAVGFDLRPAMRQAARHLHGQGVRRPVMVDCSRQRPSGRARIFVEEMARLGVETSVHDVGPNTVDAGVAGAEAVFDRWPRTDAIMAFNDLVAFGVLQGLRAQGRDVPGEVKVIGIDGLSIGTLVTPALTTLAIDMTQVARLAIDLVLGMSAGDLPASGPAVRRRIRHRLLVRASG